VVREDHFDRPAKNAAAKILDGHFDRLDGSLAGNIRVVAGHIAQHADLDRLGIRRLRVQGGGLKESECDKREPARGFANSSCHFLFLFAV
jgi:hypothetical protein